LSVQVASQGFEPVSGWDTQVVEGLGRIEHDELAKGGPLDPRVELLGAFS
jgi:hypothetical protein